MQTFQNCLVHRQWMHRWRLQQLVSSSRESWRHHTRWWRWYSLSVVWFCHQESDHGRRKKPLETTVIGIGEEKGERHLYLLCTEDITRRKLSHSLFKVQVMCPHNLWRLSIYYIKHQNVWLWLLLTLRLFHGKFNCGDSNNTCAIWQ